MSLGQGNKQKAKETVRRQSLFEYVQGEYRLYPGTTNGSRILIAAEDAAREPEFAEMIYKTETESPPTKTDFFCSNCLESAFFLFISAF